MTIAKREYMYMVVNGDSLVTIAQKHDMISFIRIIWEHANNSNLHSQAKMEDRKEVARQLHLGRNQYKDYDHSRWNDSTYRGSVMPDQIILYAGEQIFIPDEKKNENKVRRELTDAELHDGFITKPGDEYELILPELNIHINLDLDENEDNVKEEVYTLYSNDLKKTYKKTIKVKEYFEEGNTVIDLRFIGTPRDIKYTLELDPGPNSDMDKYDVYSNIKYDDIDYLK